ncbi:XdhC family protein [Nocardia sp. NPDC004750]
MAGTGIDCVPVTIDQSAGSIPRPAHTAMAVVLDGTVAGSVSEPLAADSRLLHAAERRSLGRHR